MDILEITNVISGLKIDSASLTPIKQDIINLFNTLDAVKSKLNVIDDNKKNINSISAKLNNISKDINNVNEDIKHLQSEDSHIWSELSNIQKILSKITNDSDNTSISDLLDRLSKLDDIDVNLNNSITSLKYKVDKIKSDLSKSINTNKTNISNIEIKIKYILFPQRIS